MMASVAAVPAGREVIETSCCRVLSLSTSLDPLPMKTYTSRLLSVHHTNVTCHSLGRVDDWTWKRERLDALGFR